jgi:hypothetical protein
VLVQGDTLHSLVEAANASFEAAQGRLDDDALCELNDLRDRLSDLLAHYKAVLTNHQIRLPYSEAPDA